MADAKNGGAPLDDDIPEGLEAIQLKCDKVTDDSLESTRRMMALCEASKEAGIKTLVMLDDQGEQLERAEGGLDTINKDMKEAEEQLAGMEKCCGLCMLPWQKTDDFENNPEYANAFKKDNNEIVTDQPGGARVTVGDGPTGPSGGYITRITNDAREDEMDENMGQVASMVGNLRNMAIDMGSEIGNQNRQLDRLNQKATLNKERIAVANQRTAKMIAKA